MKQKIQVEGLSISVLKVEESDFISLTDIARQANEPRFVVQNWMNLW